MCSMYQLKCMLHNRSQKIDIRKLDAKPTNENIVVKIIRLSVWKIEMMKTFSKSGQRNLEEIFQQVTEAEEKEIQPKTHAKIQSGLHNNWLKVWILIKTIIKSQITKSF